ncbi:MAG TPA: ATP-binding protein [Smithella sp.]|nr:ATP-binding protein [Smithella sp.]
MFSKLSKKISTFNDNITVRFRLLFLAIIGLGLTMAFWGVIQLKALDRILDEQQAKRLEDVAETVSTFYQFFPSGRGIRALDMALQDHIQSDVRLARIDIFDIGRKNVDYVAGASRIQYEWPEKIVSSVGNKNKAVSLKIKTEAGPALGLLYPVFENKKKSNIVIGVIGFSRANAEILKRAQLLFGFSSMALLLFILLVSGLSYRWIIEKPLRIMIETIDEFQGGNYAKRIPVMHNDEWGQISRHFNVMADEIQEVMNRNAELNRNLEERVREETQKVVQLQKELGDLKQLTALGQLTANLAHDLGTPIHSISGLASLLLERGDLSPDVAHKLNLIVQQTQRLDHVIQNVRRATRLPDPHFETLTVEQIFHETLSLMEPFLRKKGVETVVSIEGPVPFLYVDRYRVQTALMNLIQNSLEAMPRGGRIILSAQTVSPGVFVTTTVSDTGSGIAPEVAEKVCEPFFSTHSSEGLRGLGLAIVREIVRTHRGRMEIKSTPGEGTSVILHWPVFGEGTRSF